MTNEERIAQILIMQEITTKNVDAIAEDIKGLIATMPQLARWDEKYKSMDKRITRIESLLSWIFKAIGAAVITAIMALIITVK
jgi:uncharacterized membrane protein YidH (DUF202 family)